MLTADNPFPFFSSDWNYSITWRYDPNLLNILSQPKVLSKQNFLHNNTILMLLYSVYLRFETNTPTKVELGCPIQIIRTQCPVGTTVKQQ